MSGRLPADRHCPACSEYRRLSRRGFLGLGAGVLTAAAVPSWVPRVTYADGASASRDVVVSLFLRGGADGLSLCVPHGESAYYGLRPTLAVPPPDASGAGQRAVDLDGFFGVAPSMAPIVDAFSDGALAIVHATGLVETTRSHFEAMRFMEIGQLNPPGALASGWLGRHLASTPPARAGAVLRAVGFGHGLQRTLAGAPQAQPVDDPASYGFRGRKQAAKARRRALETMYSSARPILEAAAASTMRTVDLLKKVGFESYRPAGGAEYPDDELGYGLAAVAALVRAEVGVEAVAIDFGGWDTHAFEAPLDGHMAQQMASLAGGLAAFHADLFAAGCEDFVLVAMSEFGRNAFENGSEGTDHGHGGALIVLGGAVAGGRVVTEWPGLEVDQLYDGQDLAITIDYRDVLWEILSKRAGSTDIGSVFSDPGYAFVDRGLIVG